MSVASAQIITTVNGWKLVGAKEGINPYDSFSSPEIEYIWSYDEHDGSWNLFSNQLATPPIGINQLNYIDDGVGFWVKSKAAITIDTANGMTQGALDKTQLIGETFYYLDKNIRSKIYEQNLSIAMDLNASMDMNDSYYSDYELHSIYFGKDYITIDKNDTFGYLSVDDNTLKVYSEELKNSTLDINGFINTSDINITLNLNPEDAKDKNITDRLNGNFVLSNERINFHTQALKISESNNTKHLALDTYYYDPMYYYDVASADLNGTWSSIPVVEVNATYSVGNSIHLIANRSAKKLYLFTDQNTSSIFGVEVPDPQGVRIQLFPNSEFASMNTIYYSESAKVLAIAFNSYSSMYYYTNTSNEYIVLVTNHPIKV